MVTELSLAPLLPVTVVSSTTPALPRAAPTAPYWEVEPELGAGWVSSDHCVAAEFMSPSQEQSPAPAPMAIQLQSVSEVGNQESWAGRKVRS